MSILPRPISKLDGVVYYDNMFWCGKQENKNIYNFCGNENSKNYFLSRLFRNIIVYARFTRRRAAHNDHSQSQQAGRCQCPDAAPLRYHWFAAVHHAYRNEFQLYDNSVGADAIDSAFSRVGISTNNIK